MLITTHRLMAPPDGEDSTGGGGAAITEAPAAAPAAEPQAPAAAPSADAPKTMLEAVQRSFTRDEQGRFTKAEQDAQAAAAAAVAPGAAQAAAPVAPATVDPAKAKPEDEADITKMPEGLGVKAQERFQRLANGIKERDEQLASARVQLDYVQKTFQTHGVTQPQFEQAASVIGMLNSGNYRGALQALDEQRRQIALAIGEPQAGVDALRDFPDLRQRVDGLQMTEADALEVARLRMQQERQQRQQAATQQQAQQLELEQRAVSAGQAAVDQWAKATAAADLDYPHIEKLLMPRLQTLLDGVPPQKWAGVLRAQYELIKESGATFRRAAPAAVPDSLRPAGGGAAQRAPSSMFEAMWQRGAGA